MKWIDAYDLEKNWAGRRDCQETLPLLVRKLIRATSNSIQGIKFPAGESVLIGGWDGILEVTEKTEYLPSGVSLWEFGASKDPKGKADDDYDKRTLNPLGYNPAESTFIFVTPRLWTNGKDWADEKKKIGPWKDVRVINSEILEEWIEIAPTVGPWLAKHIGRFPEKGIQPTDDFWEEWSSGEKFRLNPEILLGGRKEEEVAVLELPLTPSITSFQGLSREESLAFIISCFKHNHEKEEDFFSRSLIVDNIETFRELAVHVNPLIIIPRFEDNGVINRAVQNGHTVLVPLGADSSNNWNNKIVLPPIDRDSFVSALMKSGMKKEFAERYSKETARNITILRRQLEFNRTIPKWALPENVADIIPALIVGRWDGNFENDKKIVSDIAGISYEDYVKKISPWLHTSDSPIVKIGSNWRLASPFDAWTNASIYLTRNDFNLLYESTINVLSEVNPAFDLKSEQRYMSAIFGKNSDFSEWIREGLIQSLILTSIFGDKLQFDLPVSADLWVDNVIAEILSSESPDLWKSFQSKLPLIAEASPTSFLKAIEIHLSKDNSPIVSLFDEDPGVISTQSYHTGLLWALEGLAWFPDYLSRAALILTKLSAIDPGGSLSNRPINSLSEIFKPWHFQTLASFDERIQVLKLMAEKERDVAWTLLVRMLPNSMRGTAFFTHRTRWRMFEQETERPVPWNEIYNTHSNVIDILLSIFDYSEIKLVKLIDLSERLAPSDRDKVLSFVEESISKVEHSNHLVWHECRNTLHEHRSHPNANWALPESDLPRYEKLYNFMSPKDDISQTIWMFDDHWPKFSEGFIRKEHSHDEQEAFFLEKRINGLTKIYYSHGIEKIIELSTLVKEAWIYGDVLANIITNESEVIQLCGLLNIEDRRFISSFIFRKSIINNTEWVFELFDKLTHLGFKNHSLAHLLIPLNQNKILWDFIDSKDNVLDIEYWKNIQPRFYNIEPSAKVIGLRKLILHKRYISAVNIAAHSTDGIPSELIVSILKLSATQKPEEHIRIEEYELTGLIEALDKRADVNSQEMINIEWLFLPVLYSYSDSRKPKKLEKELSKNPEFFMEVFKLVYKPDDESKIEEENVLSDEQIQNRARQAYDLLKSWKSIPGVNEQGIIDSKFLNKWVDKVREAAAIYGRNDVADMYIGQVLAHYPEEKDKVWPPPEIAELIERLDSEKLNESFYSTTCNKRSFTSRGPYDGGEIERGNAQYFKELAALNRNKFPLVTQILENLSKRYIEDAKRMDEEAARSKLDY